MQHLRKPTEDDCLQFPGTSYPPFCAVAHIRRGRCKRCTGAANRASAKRTAENRIERQLNQLQDSAQLEAQLEHATRAKEQVDLEKALVKLKVDEMERLQKFYHEERKKYSAK
jgi:hypothetical protein